MCKRDTESVKVAPESELSNWGNFEGIGYALDQVFAEGVGVISGGLSPYTCCILSLLLFFNRLRFDSKDPEG